MNFFERISKNFKKQQQKSFTVGQLNELLQQAAGNIDSYIDMNIDSLYQRVPKLFACVDLISSAVASFDYYVVDRDDNPLYQHKVSQFLSMPNLTRTKTQILKTMSTNKLLRGDAFAELTPDAHNPVEMFPINPASVKIKHDAYEVTEYIVGNARIPVEGMIHIQSISPVSAFVGVGKAEVAKRALKLEILSDQHNENIFINGVMLGGAISLDKDVSVDVIEDVRKALLEKYSGVTNAHKWLVVGGGAKVQRNDSNKDMEFSQLKTQIEEDILITFRVPKVMLGKVHSASRAEAKEAKRAFYENAVLPEVQDFAESLGLKLLSKEEKRRGMRIAYSSIQLDDSNDIATRAALLVNRVISLNEARSMLGFEAVVNGDEIVQTPVFDQVKDLKKKLLI